MSLFIKPNVAFRQNDIGIELSHYFKEVEDNLISLFIKTKQLNKKTENDDKFIHLYKNYIRVASPAAQDNKNIFILSNLNEKTIKSDHAIDLEILLDRLKYMKDEPVSTSEAGVVDVTRLSEVSNELMTLIDERKLYAYKLYTESDYSRTKKYVQKLNMDSEKVIK